MVSFRFWLDFLGMVTWSYRYALDDKVYIKYSDIVLSVFLLRCLDCGAILEECDDNTVSLAIVVLSTFIHRDPELAAPMLLEMLQVVGRYSSHGYHACIWIKWILCCIVI